MTRLLLSPDQDIVIAEPEVEIYPLSKGMSSLQIGCRLGVLYYCYGWLIFNYFVSNGY